MVEVLLDGVDVFTEVLNKALRVSLNTLDFTLVNPVEMPDLGDDAELVFDYPVFAGIVTSIQVEDFKDTVYVKITATNEDVAEASAAPFGLSDDPDDATTFAYDRLSVTQTLQGDDYEHRGKCTVFEPGLIPGMTVEITSVNQNWVAEEFSITDVSISWLNDDTPKFEVSFGDPMVTLNSWVSEEILPIDTEDIEDEAVSSIKIAPLSITDTHITDQAVTTPKIAAEAVTANEIAAQAITAEKLAANIVLATHFLTAESGRRVEFDTDGIRLYDSDDTLLVKIPTNGDPVYVSGAIDASTLHVRNTAELDGTIDVNRDAVVTLQSAFSTPANAPVLTQTLDYLALAEQAMGFGIGFDTAGDAGGSTDTFWVGADPSWQEAVAHEYDKATGALLRTITKTGSLTTYTTTYGATSHISESAEAASGSGDSQIATPMVMPQTGRITKVSAYFAGYGGSASARVAVWNSSGTLLANSATFTAADRALVNGNSIKYEASLTSPLNVTGGTTYWVGFLHTSAGQGFQWDKDHAGGVSTKRGDNLAGSMTGISTESGKKPNIYFTYQYDVDTSLEGDIERIIGVARSASHVWALDEAGVLFKYLQSDLSFVAKYDISASISGTDSKAGLFYNGTNLIVITTVATSAGTQLKFLTVSPTTGAVTGSVTATGAKTVSGSAATLRGGYFDGTYNYVAVVDAGGTGVFRWNASTGAYNANTDFGTEAEMAGGMTYDGSAFRAMPISRDKVYTYTDWDWTTASPIYWVAYSWYDAAATTHETEAGPMADITMNRRHKLSVTVPNLPGAGGADEPSDVRVYMLPNATEPDPDDLELQAENADNTVVLDAYITGFGTANTGTPFPSGGAAVIQSKDAVGSGGWVLQGDGRRAWGGDTFPASPTESDLFYRTDLNIEFFYDGSQWLSVTLYQMPFAPQSETVIPISATAGVGWGATPPLAGCSDVWIEEIITFAYVGGGATALGASHKWVGALQKRELASNGASPTTIATVSIDSGDSDSMRTFTSTVNALMNNGDTHVAFGHSWTKTGTPGTLRVSPIITYRLVG